MFAEVNLDDFTRGLAIARILLQGTRFDPSVNKYGEKWHLHSGYELTRIGGTFLAADDQAEAALAQTCQFAYGFFNDAFLRTGPEHRQSEFDCYWHLAATEARELTRDINVELAVITDARWPEVRAAEAFSPDTLQAQIAAECFRGVYAPDSYHRLGTARVIDVEDLYRAMVTLIDNYCTRTLACLQQWQRQRAHASVSELGRQGWRFGLGRCGSLLIQARDRVAALMPAPAQPVAR
jgi:hypothetical protein